MMKVKTPTLIRPVWMEQYDIDVNLAMRDYCSTCGHHRRDREHGCTECRTTV